MCAILTKQGVEYIGRQVRRKILEWEKSTNLVNIN